MKIVYGSDYHNDVNGRNLLTEIPASLDAVLIVAGDLNYKGRSIRDLEEVAPRWKAVVFVPGNHDWWGLGLHRTDKFDTEVQNLHVLLNRTVTIEDVTFIGSTHWTPIKEVDEWHWRQRMNDPKNIVGPDYRRLRWYHINTLHDLSCRFIEECKQIPGKKVLVTHHAICPMSNDPWYDNSDINMFFCSNKTELLDGYNVHIHGHIHYSVDYEVFGCNVVCNPYGYCRENLEFYDATRSIEL